MISQELAGKIWNCHREIEVGGKLLSDMAEAKKEADEREERANKKYATGLRDAFGRERGLTLGIPMGDNGHRILGVATDLARCVITAHIANKQAELVTLNEQARIEIG